jgi:CheY-like chemotaxis protein
MKSVCIIDDDSIYLMLARRLINMHKLSDSIIEYTDGREAFNELKGLLDSGSKLPDVIFLDVNMPIWDGWDFLDEFVKLNLSQYPEVYIVTSSTHSFDRDKAATYVQVKRCIVKPIELADLQSILGES